MHVGPRLLGGRAQECAGLEVVGAAETVLEQEPSQRDPRLAESVEAAVQRDGFPASVLAIDFEVILQIAADAGQFVAQRDAGLGEHVGGADAGTLQQGRGADGARGEDHFGVGAHFPRAYAHAKSHAGGSVAVEARPGRPRHR